MTDDLKSSVISDRTMSTESLGKKSQRASPAKTTETAPTVLTTGLNDTDSPHSEDHHEILEASTFLKPNAVTKYLLSTSRDKSARPWPQVFLAGVIGGALLAMGGLLMITVAGGSSETLPPGLISLLAGLVFPVGLVMIVFSASDLLTSNMMYCAVPFFPLTPMEVVKPVSAPRWIELAKLLGLGFLGNLGGSALVASCAAYFSNLSAPAINYAIALAHKKGTLPAATLFIRAIGANWLVCLAVYMSMSSRATGGKIAALWIPIATFVALGLEHSVANMFSMPVGMLLSQNTAEPLPFVDFVRNLAIVIPGNFVGAVVLASGGQWLLTADMSRGKMKRRRSSIAPLGVDMV